MEVGAVTNSRPPTQVIENMNEVTSLIDNIECRNQLEMKDPQAKKTSTFPTSIHGQFSKTVFPSTQVDFLDFKLS